MKPHKYLFFIAACNIYLVAGFARVAQAKMCKDHSSRDSTERHRDLRTSTMEWAKKANRPALSGDTIGPGRIVINSWDFSRPLSSQKPLIPQKKHANKKLNADSNKTPHKTAPVCDPDEKSGAAG